jgi:hypothetical protein
MPAPITAMRSGMSDMGVHRAEGSPAGFNVPIAGDQRRGGCPLRLPKRARGLT